MKIAVHPTLLLLPLVALLSAVDVVAASCGDGVVDLDEQCDDGAANGTPTSCCSSTCAFNLLGTACTDGSFCNGSDQCDGAGACSLHAGDPCTGQPQCNDICNETAQNCFVPVGMACDDGDPCTEVAECDGNGSCVGSVVGADTDGDGYCDAFEIQSGCDPYDAREIPPRPVNFLGGRGRWTFFITYNAPSTRRVAVATDPSCAAVGVCGPVPFGFTRGFCTAGRIADPCTVDADCDLPAHTCRIVANFSAMAGLTLANAVLNRGPDHITQFSPIHPGCSRKVDVILDPLRRANRVHVRSTIRTNGHLKIDRDNFLYR